MQCGGVNFCHSKVTSPCLPSDCPHQPHLSPAVLPAARCRTGSLGLYQGSALVRATYHCFKSSRPELLSKAALWSQAKASCCKDCYFPCYENIWQDGYRKEWHLWNALYLSSFPNKQKTPYWPFLPHLTGKTLHPFFLATFPAFPTKVCSRNSRIIL